MVNNPHSNPKSTEQKLLEHKTNGVVRKDHRGNFRTYEVLKSGIRKGTPKDCSNETAEHHRVDAEMHKLIITRAGKHVRRGHIRLVPQSFQEGSAGSVVWSEDRPGTELGIKIRGMSPEERKHAYSDLMSQLAHLHTTAGVAHGDLKLRAGRNLLFWDGKHAHFMDFGLARDLKGEKGWREIPGEEMKTGDVLGVKKVFGDYLNKEEIDEGVRVYQRTLKKVG
jgi:serine/threonine protein kinase